ncbi:MAG: Gfo/Idh/MocA family oxidoreductase [Clostridia bacterium]|nr:Gfo/Idh/MocA family oxidoreductase [Clostridia bacterium]
MHFKPVKTAVIGCGMISDTYLDNLKNKFSIIELVGCSDIVAEKSKKQAEKYEIKQMTNEEILSSDEIELVVNLTYASAHYEVNKQILEAGKHCYSEKMMCLTMEQADELNRIRKEKGVIFAVAPDTFLGASQQTARYIVDRGLIGEPISAVVNLSRGYHMIKTTEEDAYRKYSVMCEGGGIPYDMGGYYLHELFNICGPVESVCGYAFTRNAQREYLNPRNEKFNEIFTVTTPNTICASMKFRNNMVCSFNLSSEYTAYSEQFEIRGSEGILYLGDPNEFNGKIYIQKGTEKTEFPISHPYSSSSRGIGAADIAWAIRTKRPPRLSFEMGYHALQVINAVCECTADKKVKTFDTFFERPKPISSEYYCGGSEERNLFLY